MTPWLNYHHLQYFWTVAREGSIARASEELGISQPTISGQIKALQRSLRTRLFDRVGRRLELTDAGRIVFGYADEIFSLGRELLNTVSDQPAGRSLRLAVGITDMIPKTLARRLLEPALRLAVSVRLICREDKVDRLLMDLAARRLDVVLSDAPIGTGVHLRGYNHHLGESGVSFFAAPSLASGLRKEFPKSLSGAPMLLPTENTALRRSLSLWFDSRRIHPIVAGEFEDGAMMYAFGQTGAGAFPAPTVMSREIQSLYDVKLLGRTESVRERYYAISTEQKIKHPAVAAIYQTAAKDIFAAE